MNMAIINLKLKDSIRFYICEGSDQRFFYPPKICFRNHGNRTGFNTCDYHSPSSHI